MLAMKRQYLVFLNPHLINISNERPRLAVAGRGLLFYGYIDEL